MTRAVELAQIASAGVSEAFKNRIINGWMLIDQRNGGSVVSATNSGWAMDRWATVSFASGATTGKYTTQQVGGPAPATQGFTGCLRVTSSAATTVGAGDIYAIGQAIEGQNIQDLAWGTSSAKAITLSFWVQSSLTGNFGGALLNNDGNYNYPFQYTINAANTWEYKTVTIPGPTAGTWLTTNGVGVYVRFGLGGGSAWAQPAGTWTTTTAYTASSSVNVVSTNGATWLLTGVQFEVGTVASSFEYRSFGTELALCQRYTVVFNTLNSNTANRMGLGMAGTSVIAYCQVRHPVPMRGMPTLSSVGTVAVSDTQTGVVATSLGIQGVTSDLNQTQITVNVASGLTAFRPYYLEFSGTGTLTLSAEL
jgi:hypothetical protein